MHGSAYILPAKIAALFSNKKTKIVVRETQANHLKTKAQWVSLTGSMFFADHIICLTQEFRDQIKEKLGWLFRGKKVVVISNGINLDIYKPGNRTTGENIVIGMQSRLVRIKDHITLLKAFALLKQKQTGQAFNLKLRIAGDGDFKDELVKYTAELGLNDDVEFTGMIPEDELVVFLQSLDIYVHASLGETMSTAIMQAMACKLPIVASGVNGINNMITDDMTGLLVPVKNEQALADAIQQYRADGNLRQLHARNAFEYALANFSNQKMAESYKNIFLR
jgi:glycosyltransferase involved in cell wall biosynthesis